MDNKVKGDNVKGDKNMKTSDGYLWNNFFRKNSDQTAMYKTLKQTPLFDNLSKKELSWLEQVIHVRHYENQEVIFSQDDIGIGVYIIHKGGVNIMTHSDSAQVAENEDVVAQLMPVNFLVNWVW